MEKLACQQCDCHDCVPHERIIDSLLVGEGGERQVSDPDAVIAHGEALLEDEALRRLWHGSHVSMRQT